MINSFLTQNLKKRESIELINDFSQIYDNILCDEIKLHVSDDCDLQNVILYTR